MNNVDRPAHYNGTDCIDQMRETFGDEAVKAFCKCNAFKYMYRADSKGKPEEDKAKARWYIEYLENML